MIKDIYCMIFIFLGWNLCLCLAVNISNATYEFTVKENVPVGSVVAEVTVADQNAEENGSGTLQFSFLPSTLDRYGDTFAIGHDTGKIYLNRPLASNIQDTYLLRIIARYTRTMLDEKFVIFNVTLTVEDVNDHSPVFSVHSLTGSDSIEVPEKAKKGTVVALVSVTDLDIGENGRFFCSIEEDSNYNGSFVLHKLSDTEYKLMTNKTILESGRPAYESGRTAYYLFRITCRDYGSPSLSSSERLFINVKDENDHSPSFSSWMYSGISSFRGPYHAYIAENKDIGVDILSVFASDRDKGRNGEIVFSIGEDGQAYVTVDETGQIRAKIQFDYEKYHQLQFTVIATDRGTPSRSSTAYVKLNIEDRNDNIPEFLQSTYTFAIYEGVPAGTEVGRVYATDADDKPNNKFAYKLQGADGISFRIDPETGIIYTNASLDREQTSSYHFEIEAQEEQKDGGKSVASVDIAVADANDNYPVISYPNKTNHTVNIHSNTQVGRDIIHVVATDADVEQNGQLSYGIIQGNDGGYFIIDSTTSNLQLSKNLPAEDRTFYLLIRVADGGNPPKMSVAELDVVVTEPPKN